MADTLETKTYEDAPIEVKESTTADQTEGLGIYPNYLIDKEQFTGKYWHDGKKIYRQVLNFGALPNNTNKTSAFTVAVAVTVVSEVVDFRALTLISSNRVAVNSFYTGSYTYWSAYFGGSNLSASCTTNYDASGSTATVVVEYTRTDK